MPRFASDNNSKPECVLKRARAHALIDARGSAAVLQEAEEGGFHPVSGSDIDGVYRGIVSSREESARDRHMEPLRDTIIVLSRTESQCNPGTTAQHEETQSANPPSVQAHRSSNNQTKSGRIEELVSLWLQGKGLSIHHSDLIPTVHILCRLKHKTRNKDTQASLGNYFEQLLAAHTEHAEYDVGTATLARGVFAGASGTLWGEDGNGDALLFEGFRQYSVLWGCVRIRW